MANQRCLTPMIAFTSQLLGMLLHQGVKIDASLKPFHSLSPLPPGAACPSSALSAARVVQSFLSEHIEYQQ